MDHIIVDNKNGHWKVKINEKFYKYTHTLSIPILHDNCSILPQKPLRMTPSMLFQKRHSRRLVNIQIHLRQPTTERLAVTRTVNAAFRHGDILTLAKTRQDTLPVDSITTPTLAAVLNTGVFVHPALLKTRIDRHGVTVGGNQLWE